MVAALVAVCLLQGQGLDRKVSFSEPAMRAEPLMEKLSEASGVRLVVSQVVAPEVLFVRVKDVPLKELMDKLADAVNGEWQQEKEAWRLVRTDANARKEAGEEHKRRVKDIKAAMEPYLKNGEGIFDMARAEAVAHAVKAFQAEKGIYEHDPQANSPTLSSPMKRSLLRVIKRLDVDALAKLLPGDRIVFSTHPTKMQLRLNAAGELEQLRREHETWIAALLKVGRGNAPEARMEGNPLLAEAWTDRPGRLLVQVSSGNSMNLFQVRMYVFGEKGGILSNDSIPLTAVAVREASEALGVKQEKGEPVPLSPLSREMLDAFLSFRDQPQKGIPTLSPTLREFILNPEKQDPLSTIASDCLSELAKKRQVNAVVNVPDALLMGGSGSKTLTLNQFVRDAEAFANLQIKEEAGWIVGESLYPSVARAWYTNRLAFGRMLRSIPANGRLTLDEGALYALNARQAPYPFFEYGYVLLLGEKGGMMDTRQWRCLQFYASLSPQQRLNLANGDTIEFKFLSPRQKHIVAGWGYSSHWFNARYDPRDESARYPLSEPTDFAPNGLPPDGEVRMTKNENPVVYIVNPDAGGMAWQPHTIQNLAYQLVEREQANSEPLHRRPLTDFQLGHQVAFNFQFWFTKSHYLAQDLTDSAKGDDKTYKLDTLPTPLKAELQKALEGYRRQRQSQGGTVRTGPPPPLH